jgi:hypothetical protein
VSCLCAVTLGNIRETMRFSPLAWRLVGMLPPAPKAIKGDKGDPVRGIQVWQEALGLIFQNYNKILEDGFFVVCSDGETRNLATLIALWQGDQPEIEAACGLVGVSYVSCSCTAHTHMCPAHHCSQCFPLWLTLLFDCRETAKRAPFPSLSWMKQRYPFHPGTRKEC